jgi:hypothetical protein
MNKSLSIIGICLIFIAVFFYFYSPERFTKEAMTKDVYMNNCTSKWCKTDKQCYGYVDSMAMSSSPDFNKAVFLCCKDYGLYNNWCERSWENYQKGLPY